MLWRSNKGKNQSDEQTDNAIKPEQQSYDAVIEPEKGTTACISRQIMSREELLQSQEAKEMYEKIMTLRKSLDSLKNLDAQPAKDVTLQEDVLHKEDLNREPLDRELLDKDGTSLWQEPSESEEGIYLEETGEILAAEKAIMEQAQRDAEEERLKQEETRRRELLNQQEKMRILELEKQTAIVEEEAVRKRQQAIEAKKRADEAARKKALEDMEAAHRRSEEARQRQATPEELASFFEQDKDQYEKEKDLEVAKEALLSAQAEQEKILEHIHGISETETEYLAEKQKLQAEKSQKIIKEQKAEMDRLKKLERARKKREEREQRAEDKERHRREKREASEQARLEKARAAAAELGGGIVNVNGVTINTEIKEVPRVSWKDFFGLASKKEKTASSKAEQRALKKEREKRREEARATVDKLGKETLHKYRNSIVGRKFQGFKLFCEHHKAVLLVIFAVILTASVGTAGIFNYCTAYEYSYNGKSLGIVKEKDEVLEITDMVQGALTEDKNVSVVIDAKDDITFKRVSAMGDVKIDNTEEVLKRLTYMGDLNVKAYGIYVDGEKVGAVESKEIAVDVMKEIKDKYASGQEDSKIEEAVFIEDVEVKQSNTGLQDISSKNEMVDLLCTSGEKETLHKVVAGETLADIANLYSMTEKDILKENESVDPKKLEVGSTIIIKQNAPILTVKITELLTYEKQVEYKVDKQDSKDIYEGYSETKQKGENGLSEITARIVTVNGEAIKETALVTTVKKEPVTEVVLVGVKDRPPTVGSGKYICPLKSSYTLTSGFGYRWGSMHSGLDMACSSGTTVYAADGGTVTQAGYNGSYGYLVVIDHQNGMETYYAHNSKLLVSAGDKVFQGQPISKTGSTGRSTGPHLHFEVHVNGTAKNPSNYLP